MNIDYFAIEGPDYASKSTVIEELKVLFEKELLPLFLTKEPGGTPQGAALRNLLQNPKVDFNYGPRAQALMQFADKVETQSLITKHLSKGEIVISDRSVLSTICYQGYIQKELQLTLELMSVLKLRKPKSTFIITISKEEALRRAHASYRGIDKLDSLCLNRYDEFNSFYKNIDKVVPGVYHYMDGERDTKSIAIDIFKIIKQELC